MKTLFLLLAPLAACTMHAATMPDAPATGTVNYTCTDGYVVPVTFGMQDDGTKSVVLKVDGNSYTLLKAKSATGTRYAWPSDGSNFVWQIQGGVGTVLWHDGTSGTEQPRFTDCRAS
ncbi:MAG: MliC family protein [Paracoccaceae bacterium]